MRVLFLIIKVIVLVFLFSCFLATSMIADENISLEDDIEQIKLLAKSGDPEAQFSLALMLDMGDRIEMDKPAAISWFEKAAVQGLPAACLYLGMKYEFGNAVDQDHSQAIFWYRKAALQNWADAQFHLGRVLLETSDARKDRIEAYAWLGLAGEWYFPGADEEKKKVKKLLSNEEVILAEKLQEKLRKQLEN